MTKADFTEMTGAIAMPALARLAKELWHYLDTCSCDKWPYFVAGKPCEIGLEELQVKKAERLFAEWDAHGLGYIGPRL